MARHDGEKTNPSLMGLPVETLGRILGFLGPDFLKGELGRLTISKKWYSVAQEELYCTLPLASQDLLLFRNQNITPIWAEGRVHTVEIDIRHSICMLDQMHPTAIGGPSDSDVDEFLYQRSVQGLFYYTVACQAVHALHTREVTQAFQLLQQARAIQKIELKVVIYEPRLRRDPDWIDPPCGRAGYLTVRQLSQLNLPALKELDLNMPES